MLKLQLKNTIAIMLVFTSAWAHANEVASGKGDLYSAPIPELQIPIKNSETTKIATPPPKPMPKPERPQNASATIPNNSEPTVFVTKPTEPIAQPNLIIEPAAHTIEKPKATEPTSPSAFNAHGEFKPLPMSTPKSPIVAKPFTLKSGDFVKATSKDYQFYKLDKKGQPTRLKKLPAGTGFKVIKPNKNDTRVEFTSGPLKGSQAFMKKSLVEEIIQTEGLELPGVDYAAASATQETEKAETTQKVKIAPEALDEGDESGLEGTVPDNSPEAVAMILKNCKDCTERDIKSNLTDKTVGEVFKAITFQKAKYIYPIKGARITSKYGMRRHPLLGYSKMHHGTDFAGNSKTPIRASRAGKVIFAGKKGAYGNIVIIQHADGYTTRYAHLSKFGKGIKVGALVEQGQWLGNVGATGRVTGPHLHFEIRDKKGNSLPPTKYLGK